jgi:outer membrane protein
MKHLLVTCLLSVILAFGLSAQTEQPVEPAAEPVQNAPKFGNIDMAQLFKLLPETQAIENELAQIQKAYDNEIQKMGEDYQIKVSDFVAVQQSLDPNIAEARAQEIEQLQQRIQQFREKAANSLREQREAKTAPIIQRVSQAIQAVGEKYGYTYIFDLKQAGIMYFSPAQCDDVFPLVKAELGF